MSYVTTKRVGVPGLWTRHRGVAVVGNATYHTKETYEKEKQSDAMAAAETMRDFIERLLSFNGDPEIFKITLADQGYVRE